MASKEKLTSNLHLNNVLQADDGTITTKNDYAWQSLLEVKEGEGNGWMISKKLQSCQWLLLVITEDRLRESSLLSMQSPVNMPNSMVCNYLINSKTTQYLSSKRTKSTPFYCLCFLLNVQHYIDLKMYMPQKQCETKLPLKSWTFKMSTPEYLARRTEA